jgi:hypothetical protein
LLELHGETSDKSSEMPSLVLIGNASAGACLFSEGFGKVLKQFAQVWFGKPFAPQAVDEFEILIAQHLVISFLMPIVLSSSRSNQFAQAIR